MLQTDQSIHSNWVIHKDFTSRRHTIIIDLRRLSRERAMTSALIVELLERDLRAETNFRANEDRSTTSISSLHVLRRLSTIDTTRDPVRRRQMDSFHRRQDTSSRYPTDRQTLFRNWLKRILTCFYRSITEVRQTLVCTGTEPTPATEALQIIRTLSEIYLPISGSIWEDYPRTSSYRTTQTR